MGSPGPGQDPRDDAGRHSTSGPAHSPTVGGLELLQEGWGRSGALVVRAESPRCGITHTVTSFPCLPLSVSPLDTSGKRASVSHIQARLSQNSPPGTFSHFEDRVLSQGNL